MKLMPSANNFMCKSAAPSQAAQYDNYKLVIQSVNFIIHTKKLISTAHGALMDQLVHQNMRHHLSRVQIIHLAILQTRRLSTSITYSPALYRI